MAKKTTKLAVILVLSSVCLIPFLLSIRVSRWFRCLICGNTLNKRLRLARCAVFEIEFGQIEEISPNSQEQLPIELYRVIGLESCKGKEHQWYFSHGSGSDGRCELGQDLLRRICNIETKLIAVATADREIVRRAMQSNPKLIVDLIEQGVPWNDCRVLFKCDED